MIEINEKRKEELKVLALHRANEILESWWWECTGEFADEESLNDEELDYTLDVNFKISLK